MIKVLIEAEAGSCTKNIYNEKTLEYKDQKYLILPFPFPYGFIVNTVTETEECVVCYLITNDPMKAGQIIECEPIGMLEQKEGDEIDNKILACMPMRNIKVDEKTLAILRDFIYGVFKEYPNTHVQIGKLLSKDEALKYIKNIQMNDA